MKIGVISLGCPKNLTDTEVILGKLASAGFGITAKVKEADVIIINTCAFIKGAKEEAIDTILDIAGGRQKDQLLIVAGCLAQRYKKELPPLFPQVDGWIGSGSIDKIVEFVRSLTKSHKRGKVEVSKEGSCLFDHKTPRIKATPPWYAYVKIADGCDNRCSYCAVPIIRGRFKSRPIESIVKEVKSLANRGVKEVIFVAHDTTMYGKGKLPLLLKKVSKIDGIEWIRIMYAHPAHVTDKLLEIIANEPKICKYLDLPIQHICDRILNLMGRGVSKKDIKHLITKIRRSIPGIILRTSLIVGFPTESEEDFEELLNFVKETRFERLGVFTYSKEEGTGAAKLRGMVPERIKKSRYGKVMQAQRHISKELNQKMIGKTLEILVENQTQKGCLGRSYMDAPEIDGSVLVRNSKISPGEIAKARITSASSYDLVGRYVT